MKLIECYIENFGTLHDFHYSFDDGLNVLNRDNGFGKTTFSVFIKAMFYGLDDTKKLKLEENDRKHYMPWQGGVFGGWLTFTTGALGYKVERTFGSKESEDTYTLYELETGKVSLAYQDGLGEKIFGIDADGFERTVFLSERRLSQKSDNKSVSAKLSDLVGCDFDLGELDKALSMLEERRKFYYKKGGSGQIGDIKGEIAFADSDISRILRIKDTLPEREKNIAELGNKINERQAFLNEYAARASRAQNELAYCTKEKAIQDIENRLADTVEFFSGKVPDESEVLEVERASAEAVALRAELGNTDADEKKRAELQAKIEKADEILEKLAKADQKKSAKKAHAGFFAAGILLAIVGALLFLTPLANIGVIPLACGGAAIVLGLFLLIKRNSGRSANEGLFNEAKHFLDGCGKGYVQRDDYQKEIYETKSQLYKESGTISEKMRTSVEKTARLEALEKKCSDFLSKFKTKTSDPFSEIRKNITDHKLLSWRLNDARNELNSFVRMNGIDPEKIDRTSNNAKDLLNADPEVVKSEVLEMSREKALFEREYRDAHDEAARLDEYIAKKDELTDLLHAAEDKYKVINLTRDHLNAAKDRLTTKYLGKTRDTFREYISLMTGEAPELFNISVDFGITRSIGSVSKPEEAYSLGTRELYSLAARLALNDSLYDVDMPPIILDDPFAHLDDKKYASAAKIIKRLAASRQIIYLTCSKSRMI